MLIKKRYETVISYFRKNMPVAETELVYKNPYQLLVAVILSAQCTDKRVNMVTPELFKAFPTAKKLSETEPEEVFEYIKSISYPNNKAKHLVGMARMLLEKFEGTVPSELDNLIQLPGVGRKTANVISSVVFNNRVAARLGLTRNAKTPLAAEKQLVKHIPEELIATAHHWLILHGRYVCTARNPKCNICGLKEVCVYYKKHPI